MTSKEILHAELLDILFENRNKEYGAYALRKNYDQRMISALVIMLLLAGVFSYFALSRNNHFIESPLPVAIPEIITVIIPPKPDDPEPTAIPPKTIRNKPVASVKSTNAIQIEKDLLITDVPDQQELSEKIIDVINIDGELPADRNVVKQNKSNPGDGAAPTKPVEEVSPGFIKEESGAAFPGGLSAFSSFLSKHLRAPADLSPGEKKTVLAQFKVDINGKISEIVILNSAGENYDKEVIRVLNKMPAWKPAVQNGHKTAIYFKQPVSFLGIE